MKLHQSSNVRAVRLWNSLCPGYFWVMAAKAVFENLSPYFNIYMSAEIVKGIVENKQADSLILLAAITVAGNFAIMIISGLLNRCYSHKRIQLDQKEERLFTNKMLTMDYEEIENVQVHQLRRKITESEKIDGHGKMLLLNGVEELVYNIINILLAFYLFLEMFFQIISFRFNYVTVIFFVVLAVLITLNILCSFSVHFIHESLLYGYDDDKNEVYCISFDQNRVFGSFKIRYDCLKDSFQSVFGSKELNEYEKFIYILTPACMYPDFKLNKFLHQLDNYILGKVDEIDQCNYNFLDFPEERKNGIIGVVIMAMIFMTLLLT